MDSGQGNWAGVVKNTFGVCEDFSLKKGWFFISFCTLSKIIVDFCQKIMAEFPKLQSTCPEKIFERKKNWQKDEFLVILYFEIKKLDFGQKNLAGIVKTLFGASRGKLWGFFIEKKEDFSYLFALSAKLLLPSAKYSWQGFQNFNLRAGENFWEKKSDKKMIS